MRAKRETRQMQNFISGFYDKLNETVDTLIFLTNLLKKEVEISRKRYGTWMK